MIPGRIFDDLLGVEKTPASRSMLCDISEDDNAYYLELEIPGFAKDDIKIEYDKGILKIVAEKTISSTDDKNYIHRERRSYSKCERAFSLTDVDEDAIKDIFNNGILQINVPKLEKQETKKIVNID